MASGNGNGNGFHPNGSTGKPPMLLLHGFTAAPVVWDPILALLEPHHDVVAINLPGHYGGPEFTDPKGHIADALVDMVEEQMDALGWERAHIVGNSLGGWAALLLAERRRALTTVAISPGGGWTMDGWAHKRIIKWFRNNQRQIMAFEPLAYELVKRPRTREILMREAVAHPKRLPGSLAKQWITAAAQCPAWKLLLEYAPTVNAPETMDGLEGPVRIAWGTKDRILPYDGYADEWKRVLPDADWVTLEDVGHVPMSDDPQLIANTILEVSTADTTQVVEPD
jgi:pimeloyl-ACP methyl ester carboxylesterase